MRLSPNFTLARLIRSDTAERLGIGNTPGPDQVGNLARLAAAMEQVLGVLGHDIAISSGYRCPALNAAVGGAPQSRHVLGLAVDFTCARFGTPLEAARAVAASPVAFDQLIHEYGRWVHLGLAPEGSVPRRQLLTICSGGAGYVDGLVSCG